MTSNQAAYAQIRDRVRRAAELAGHPVRLLAVSKTQPAAAVRAVAQFGQRAFGENYVQEALAKRRELAAADAGAGLEWHLIGPLQSNKCRDAAAHFDWVQSVDRQKLVDLLDRFRPDAAVPLDVLIQVNVDDEPAKAGCAPEAIGALAERIAAAPRLRLRGLMAIPQPHPDAARRRAGFERMRAAYDALARDHGAVDTLSLGMSDDFELAIAAGATMVRIGTALFGARKRASREGAKRATQADRASGIVETGHGTNPGDDGCLS